MLGKGDMRAVSASGLGPQDREATAFSTEALYYWGFVRLGVAVIAEPRGLTAASSLPSIAVAAGSYVPSGLPRPDLRFGPRDGLQIMRTPAHRIADCSDLTIVPTWTWMGLPGKGSAVSRSQHSRPIDEGDEVIARLVAASL
jgi:hypothetical protein